MKPLAKGEFARIFGGVIVLLTILLGVLAVVQTLALSPIWSKEADGAGWVGAIGTVGTLIWAIILASSQERQRRSDSLTTARLLAAGMNANIQSACVNIESIISDIDGAMLAPENMFRSAEAIQKLEVIKELGDTDLTRLVPLPNNFAIKLAETVGHLTHLITCIRNEFPQAIYMRVDRSDELNALSGISSTLHILYETFEILDYECRSSKHALYNQSPVQDLNE